MADRLYLGPVTKQLRGNRDDALTLERAARIKVGYLFDSMMPLQTFRSGAWNLQDGRSIMAFVWDDVLGKRATVRLVGVGGVEPPTPLFPDAFMESGLCNIVNASEANFSAAQHYTNNNKSYYYSSYPTWLDWIAVSQFGVIGGRTREYTNEMTPLTWDYTKTVVSPTAQYLTGASSGKLKMLVQAQMGTVYGVGTVSLAEYIASGGVVIGPPAG